MTYFTYSQIKEKLENDTDLIDEDFISETELLGYMNEAIDDAEAVIHTLGLESSYFLKNAAITLANGTSDYDYPSDIYAMKIRKIFYVNGNNKYLVQRVRDLNTIQDFLTGDNYQYLPVNVTAGPKLRFFPTPAESGAYIDAWYIRNVRKLTTSTADSNTCEIPECINFLFAHCKSRIYEKEGNPNLIKAVDDVKKQHDLMVQILQEMVPDEDNEIIPNLSFYENSEWIHSYRGT